MKRTTEKKPVKSERDEILSWLPREIHSFCPLQPTERIKFAYKRLIRYVNRHTTVMIRLTAYKKDGREDMMEKTKKLADQYRAMCNDRLQELKRTVVRHNEYRDDEPEDIDIFEE